jgi:5-(carboxyamino)imidazole ribonucleotide synthase
MVKRIGVIGGGQLAWMMAQEAEKLGIELIVQTPCANDPAVTIASKTIFAAIDDATATAQLADRCDLITFENEFVNLDALSLLERQGVCFRPSLSALKPLLDKYDQRCYLRSLGLPTPEFTPYWTELVRDFPIVLKTRRHGYDGQGTCIIRNESALVAALKTLGDRPLLLEAFIPFERELAVIAARSVTGEIAIYPLVETQQEQQVCRRVFAPAKVAASVTAEAEAIAQTLLTSLQFVGVLGIELFLTADGTLLVNEMAPRTHNSGHFSLDACATSQFEQQLRAVAGLPLGEVALRSPAAVMVNLLGYEQSHSDYYQQRQQFAALPQTFVHWYGKTESRPGRKLGHVTALVESEAAAIGLAHHIEALWYPIA